MNIIKLDFKGHQVNFNDDGWINATDVANYHNKRLDVWLKSNETNDYILALMEHLNTTKRWELIKTKRGNLGGTWLHPKLSINFARWISPSFAVWCDVKIDELRKSGKIEYTNEQLNSILTHKQPLSWEKRFQHPFYLALAKMTNLPFHGHIGGCPALFGKITSDWVYRVVLPESVYRDIKDRMNKSEKVHQFLKPDAMELVEKQLEIITNIAKGCIDYKDFEARCSTIFNIQGQIKLILAS